ncbi:MAG: hypothetical protein F6K08_32575 [Okeania sp. SIO1H6]|nr:hypothetical protein [Okeania sp. SIO1H6]
MISKRALLSEAMPNQAVQHKKIPTTLLRSVPLTFYSSSSESMGCAEDFFGSSQVSPVFSAS